MCPIRDSGSEFDEWPSLQCINNVSCLANANVVHKHRRGGWHGQADDLRTGLADASMRECTETQEAVGAKSRIGERSTKREQALFGERVLVKIFLPSRFSDRNR
jgi:hypothetical protein